MKDETGTGSTGDSTPTLTGYNPVSELRAGDILGERFRIVSLIGIGGMGVVYRARDRSLDIDVALKLLRPELARRPDAFESFRRELLLARQVSSPYVVRIHDIAEHAGRWFISMDYIEGQSLEQRRDVERRQSPELALAIVRGVLEGLDAAHQRGVVHRDLKPANILLDGDDHPYITDFGVARVLGSTGLSQTGMIVGTPEYLSPEQARGGNVDARSDLYTLGLILYEMLSGELPFAGGTPAEAMVQRILRPPPSLAKARPDLPSWLHALCDRLLKVNPQHRFESARQTLRAIESRRVPRPPLNRKLLALGLLGLIALGGTATWLWNHPQPWRELAAAMARATPRIGVLPLQTGPGADAGVQAAARAIEEHLHQWLRGDPAIAAIPRPRMLDATARAAPQLGGEALLRKLPEVANAASVAKLLHGRLQRDGGTLVLELDWFDANTDATHESLIVRGADPARLFDAYRRQAATWLAAADLRPGRAPDLAPEMVETYGRALLELDGGNAPEAASTLSTALASHAPAALTDLVLLEAQQDAGQTLPAENTRDRILQSSSLTDTSAEQSLRVHALLEGGDDAALRETLGRVLHRFPHDPELALLNARVLADQGDGSAALDALQEYVRTDQQDARAWFLLGRTSIVQGQAQPAVDEYLVRALVLNTRARNTAAEAETRNALGIGYERLGQLDAAVEQYLRAADVREKLGDTVGLSRTLRNLAIVQAQRGERDAAEKNLLRVKALLEKTGDRASLADLDNDRGVIAEERGDFVAALSAYRDALGLRQQLDVPDLVAESLNNVAFASLQLGQFDNALVYWQQALALYRQLDGVDRMLRIELSIGLLDVARGHYAEARARLQDSLRDAEDRQLPEEASIGHINLAELALAEGRLADVLEHAGLAGQIAAQRTDLRTATEATLLQGRARCELGDARGIDEALASLPATIDNSEQLASRLLVESCRAHLAGDLDAARTQLESAARIAAEIHSGKLGTEIRLRQLRLALAGGESGPIARQLQILKAESAQVREFPQQLEWLSLQIAAAIRAKDKAEAVRRYRDALGLLKGIDSSGAAFMLHGLGSLALDTDSSEASAAQRAEAEARNRLLADAPEASRPLLREWLERRLREQSGVEHVD